MSASNPPLQIVATLTAENAHGIVWMAPDGLQAYLVFEDGRTWIAPWNGGNVWPGIGLTARMAP